jgi:hypothetical protein
MGAHRQPPGVDRGFVEAQNLVLAASCGVSMGAVILYRAVSDPIFSLRVRDNLLAGEDAQEWGSRRRREADERREK